MGKKENTRLQFQQEKRKWKKATSEELMKMSIASVEKMQNDRIERAKV